MKKKYRHASPTCCNNFAPCALLEGRRDPAPDPHHCNIHTFRQKKNHPINIYALSSETMKIKPLQHMSNRILNSNLQGF